MAGGQSDMRQFYASWLLRPLVMSVLILGCSGDDGAFQPSVSLRPEMVPPAPGRPSLASLLTTPARTPTLTSTRLSTRTARPSATVTRTPTPLPPLSTRAPTSAGPSGECECPRWATPVDG